MADHQHESPTTHHLPPTTHVSLDRRDFVGRLAASALLAGMPLPVDASVRALSQPSTGRAEEWDLSWVKRLTGKYRAIFDVPEIDSGYGVWRASIWGKQYQEVLGAKPNELSSVLVLRHNGIQLAMQQAYWDKYGIGKEKTFCTRCPAGYRPKPGAVVVDAERSASDVR